MQRARVEKKEKEVPVGPKVEDELESKECNTDCQSVTQPLTSWFTDLYANRNELWQKVKEDFTEVACVAKSETQHFVQSLEENEKRLDVNGLMHHLSSGISNMSSKGNEYIKTFLLPPTQDDSGEEVLQLNMKDLSVGENANTSLDVKIQILRADPRTYLSISKAPQGCVRPGVPLEGKELMPEHETPSEILEKCPAMKKHLHRLVNPELGLRRSKDDCQEGISEVDFWSRYYYRVWCLHVMEARKRNLGSVAVGRTRWESTSSGEEAEKLKVEQEDGIGSTPEILTAKSDSPVLLSENEACREEKTPNKAEAPEEEDDWENWS
ncbi:hypothetical protein Ciccas_008774 [Cichlidogyrus casuarinus]|uniref:BSD domain containing 1 n=1 Tax=Cichlidogyrus casuarinus TaxID=1844966 RepID=A0ABD2PYW8_9PLAT